MTVDASEQALIDRLKAKYAGAAAPAAHGTVRSFGARGRESRSFTPGTCCSDLAPHRSPRHSAA